VNRPYKIKDEWIEQVINNPVHSEIQSDGRIKKWAKIEDAGKYLRVILLEDGETVHNNLRNNKLPRNRFAFPGQLFRCDRGF